MLSTGWRMLLVARILLSIPITLLCLIIILKRLIVQSKIHSKYAPATSTDVALEELVTLLNQASLQSLVLLQQFSY